MTVRCQFRMKNIKIFSKSTKIGRITSPYVVDATHSYPLARATDPACAKPAIFGDFLKNPK